MVALNDPNYVKRVQDLYNTDPKKGAMFLDAMGKGLPIEVRPLFDELANASIAGKDIDDVIDTAQVVVIKKGDETTIHTIAPDGTVIKSNSIDEAGDLIEPDVKTKTNAQTDVNTKLGKDTKGTGGSKSIKEIEIDPNDNPDNIKGEILTAIEEGFEKLGGKTPTPKSIDEVIASIEDGKVLTSKTPDGKIRIVNHVEMKEIIIDPDTYEVLEIKNLGDKDIPPPKGDSPQSGGVTTKNNQSAFWDNIKKGTNAAGQFFRWTMPTVSEGVRLVSAWIPPIKRKYGGWIQGGRFSVEANRFSLIPGKKIDNDLVQWLRRGSETPELLARLGTEQLALIGIYGIYKTIERGGLPDEESWWATAFADYPESWFFKYHPLSMVTDLLVSTYEDLSSARDIAITGCRKKLEKTMDPDKITGSEEFENCKEKIDSFFGKIDDVKKSLNNIRGKYDDANWDDKKKMEFCEDKEGQKTQLYADLDNLIKSTTELEKESDRIVDTESAGTGGIGFVEKIVGALNWVLPIDMPNVPDINKIKNNLLPKLEDEGQPLTPTNLKGIKKGLDDMCREYFNTKSRENEPVFGPDPEERKVKPTSSEDSDEKKSLEQQAKDAFGSITVEVEEINIV